ncbi:MAG: hypothetical protein MJY87_00890 [Fibrobacter sp.]|nr:hypothetical protein [Fibrobacter sp.]
MEIMKVALFKKIFSLIAFLAVFVFAAETSPAGMDSVQALPDQTKELLAEIALRDSLMAVRDSSCVAEKDSMRFALTMERAISQNWQQSYETMRKDGEACTQALRTAREENENKVNEAEKSNSSSVIVPTSTFLGGLGIGMLLFWLFF